LPSAPFTPGRWVDLETLFGPRGACAGWWRMRWRLGRSPFERRRRAASRQAHRAIVETASPPGLFAHGHGHPAGCCSLAPREAYGRWAASPGGRILEGLSVDTRGRSTAGAFAHTGQPSAFEPAGFREAARPSPTRPVMRLSLTGRDFEDAG